jgi:HNH endonuclease
MIRRSLSDQVEAMLAETLQPKSLFEQFFASVKNGPVPAHRPELGACWVRVTSGRPRRNGYTRTKITGRLQPAHRVAYELAVGPIPQGLWALHKCDFRPCIRPDHIFLGTALENNQDCASKLRYPQQQRERCQAGHEYAGANLYLTPSGTRSCRACTRERESRRPDRREQKRTYMREQRAAARAAKDITTTIKETTHGR